VVPPRVELTSVHSGAPPPATAMDSRYIDAFRTPGDHCSVAESLVVETTSGAGQIMHASSAVGQYTGSLGADQSVI